MRKWFLSALLAVSFVSNANAAIIMIAGEIDQVSNNQDFSVGDTFTAIIDINEEPIFSPALLAFGALDLNNATVAFDNGITVDAAVAVTFDNIGPNTVGLNLAELDLNQGTVFPTNSFPQIFFVGNNPASDSFEDYMRALNQIEISNFGLDFFSVTGSLTSVDYLAAVPIPAAAWFFGSAIVGLAGARKIKK